MPIETVFAEVRCTDLAASVAWYAKLFGRDPDRKPNAKLAEWQFTDSAEVQLIEDGDGAGSDGLTLGVLPMRPEHERITAAGIDPGEIKQADGYFTMRMTDPDGNRILLASARLD